MEVLAIEGMDVVIFFFVFFVRNGFPARLGYRFFVVARSGFFVITRYNYTLYVVVTKSL